MGKHLVKVWCDGACSPNPGMGGWGAVMEFNGQMREFSDVEEQSTSNRMEILAAIGVLEAIRVPCDVTLYSDSTYLVNSVMLNWKKNKNLDLWDRLYRLLDFHSVTMRWVRGHGSNPGNMRADELAVEARLRFEGETDNQTRINEKIYRRLDAERLARVRGDVSNGMTINRHTPGPSASRTTRDTKHDHEKTTR